MKTKYTNLGFTEKAFAGVADYLASTVTEETEIDNAISGVESLLKAFQGDVDARVTSAIAKAKAEASKGGGQQPKKEEEEKIEGESVVIRMLNEMRGELTALKSEKQQETLATKWRKAANEKGIKNDKLIEKWQPKSDDDFETSLNDLVEFNKTIQVNEANESYTGKAASGKSQSGKVSQETQSKLDSWAKSKEPAKQD